MSRWFLVESRIITVQVKGKKKYRVVSEKGRNLGTYPTRAEAEKRLQEVEMFKHMKKKNK